jgi:hypothetical protein
VGIDIRQVSKENAGMNTTAAPLSLMEADAEAVITHAITGKPLDADIARRIRERSELATEKLRRKVGTVDVAVNLIREVRDRPSYPSCRRTAEIGP